MKLEKPGYNLSSMSVLFIANDGNDKFVCNVTPEQLDPDNWFSLTETQMLDIFWNREQEILKAAGAIIGEARRQGVRHSPGVRNDPLPVTLL